MSILRASVLGAIDGIITSFAIISIVYASETDTKTILAISLSSLVADATSMGVGEYLSSNAEHTTSSKKLFELQKQILLTMPYPWFLCNVHSHLHGAHILGFSR